MNLELIMMMFDDADAANDAYNAVRTLQTDGMIDIVDAAMLVKRRDGTAQIHDTQDVDAPHAGCSVSWPAAWSASSAARRAR